MAAVQKNTRRQKSSDLFPAVGFRVASLNNSVFSGVLKAYTTSELHAEKERLNGRGVSSLVRSSVARLKGKRQENEWVYTEKHSLEVAYFVYIMARAADELDVWQARSMDPNLIFAGGLIHDIGKTFLPDALVVKELGVRVGPFTMDKTLTASAGIMRKIANLIPSSFAKTAVEAVGKVLDSGLEKHELDAMRDTHLTAGTTYVRMFGGGQHLKVMLDMVGLHHVMFDGKDRGRIPSYPSMMKGSDLPFHPRMAKTADFLSAVLPRHYRKHNKADSLEDALAYAVSVAGGELDPLAVRCFMAGMYDVPLIQSKGLVDRFSGSSIQEIREDPEFASIVGRDPGMKLMQYKEELDRGVQKYGIRIVDGDPIDVELI